MSQSFDRSSSYHSSSWKAQSSEPDRKHSQDVELGPLIGQGAFGKVYRGIWNGAPVAVKVRRLTQAYKPLVCYGILAKTRHSSCCSIEATFACPTHVVAPPIGWMHG